METRVMPKNPPQSVCSGAEASPEELSTTQNVALDALLSGKTITEAAAAAGISRTTLYDWQRRNYAFRAALNRRRAEQQQAIGCQLEKITADAAQCVANAVRDGNAKVALEILKSMQALTPRAIESDDPRVLKMQEEAEAMKVQDRLTLAAFRR